MHGMSNIKRQSRPIRGNIPVFAWDWGKEKSQSDRPCPC